jgi:hypothetical protein
MAASRCSGRNALTSASPASAPSRAAAAGGSAYGASAAPRLAPLSPPPAAQGPQASASARLASRTRAGSADASAAYAAACSSRTHAGGAPAAAAAAPPPAPAAGRPIRKAHTAGGNASGRSARARCASAGRRSRLGSARATAACSRRSRQPDSCWMRPVTAPPPLLPASAPSSPAEAIAMCGSERRLQDQWRAAASKAIAPAVDAMAPPPLTAWRARPLQCRLEERHERAQAKAAHGVDGRQLGQGKVQCDASGRQGAVHCEGCMRGWGWGWVVDSEKGSIVCAERLQWVASGQQVRAYQGNLLAAPTVALRVERSREALALLQRRRRYGRLGLGLCQRGQQRGILQDVAAGGCMGLGGGDQAQKSRCPNKVWSWPELLGSDVCHCPQRTCWRRAPAAAASLAPPAPV